MTNLPVELSQLSAGLALAVQKAPVSGSPFIKLDKAGDWVFGSDAFEVRDGVWAINPNSFIEGFIAWGDGELLGEEMAPMQGTALLSADLPEHAGAKKGWEKQVGCQMVALSGEFKGTQVVYKTSSKGGVKCLNDLVVKVVNQIDSGDAFVPAVRLESSSYKHKTYGKINVPILAVDHWTTMDGVPDEALDETEPTQAPEAPEKAPTKRRRIAG